MKNSFPKTVFRTAHPQFEVSENYEIWITPIPAAPDPHQCWIVRQSHGYFDDIGKTFHNIVDTVYPDGKQRLLTCAEAIQQANELVVSHAQAGFRFLFVTSYVEPTPPWYKCVEILPNGEYKPIPESTKPCSIGGWASRSSRCA